jgi:hypothetical protein
VQQSVETVVLIACKRLGKVEILRVHIQPRSGSCQTRFPLIMEIDDPCQYSMIGQHLGIMAGTRFPFSLRSNRFWRILNVRRYIYLRFQTFSGDILSGPKAEEMDE